MTTGPPGTVTTEDPGAVDPVREDGSSAGSSVGSKMDGPTTSVGKGSRVSVLRSGMVLWASTRSVSNPAKNENDRSTPNVVGLRLSTYNPLTQDAKTGKRAQP
jgi:hypothetical protein